MSLGARTEEAAPQPAAAPAAGGQVRDLAGRTFRQLTVLPALLAMAWLLAGLPLLLLGHFSFALMLVLSIPIAIVLVTLGLRWVSGPSQGPLAARGAAPAATPWWVVIAVIVIAVAFGADQFLYHSQQIIVNRDPASYIQFANWISHHGSLPIPQDNAAFGGVNKALTFNTAAFYDVGRTIVPQFMAGLPMTLAAAFWIGGLHAATAMGTLLGACGVLVFGGLVARLVGPRWAPLGALVLALSLPEMFTSRSTYSEPLVQILLLGGLCLLIDSFSTDGLATKGAAALAGLALGLTLLVRIDGASDMLPLIPYCGLALVGRYRQAWPLIAGIVAGTAYGAVDGLVLSRPYLTEIKGSLIPLVLIGALVLVVTAVAVAVYWRRGVPQLRTDRLPNLAAALAFLVTIALVIRPYVQTATETKTHAEQLTMAKLQRAQHLAVAPDRTYYEISLHWVFWYLGILAVILATIGAALLARRCLRGNAPAWTLPLMAFAWIIVTTLLRPGIVPDQPWASRRLVPGVLPGFILLAVWVTSWLAGWLRQRGVQPVVRGGVVAVIALALVLPVVRTSWGIAHKSGGPAGIRLVAVGLGDNRTFAGEVPAVQKMCKAIPANASVVFVDHAGNSMAQVVRGMCGVPTALATKFSQHAISQLVADIRRAGRRPVLLAGQQADLTRYGLQPTQIMHLRTRGDPHQLTTAPVYRDHLNYNVWMSEFSQ
jgi:hypothetical protein